jgi:tRNA threonylcarbamoyladenosine biosynthesis protein TsaE
MIYKTQSAEETQELGVEFSATLKFGDIIGLKGELGSGKTQFVKGIGEYFTTADTINSPTFIIVNDYDGIDPVNSKPVTIHHFDLYRLENPSELEVIGFNEYMDKNSIILIEWCELAEKYLGKELRKVIFKHGEKENERIIEL